ncbi:hypothetical protein Gogos_009857 [Gossypium gossypioides]|uniref:Uncharacterized protein n=1 Tax=Gossypium gossypioides TaxID=34282 RepID=A0A7J9BJF7_GOSGO|nr:hypothetical protein [Gossypium gossypioides]
MKWISLLKDIKEKVGLTQAPAASAAATASSSSSSSSSSNRDARASYLFDYIPSPSSLKLVVKKSLKLRWGFSTYCTNIANKQQPLLGTINCLATNDSSEK